MRKGFTILELLVASLLLGMLMTILTMIFNQSSIAWRTGVAGVVDLDDARSEVSVVRYEADNAYFWGGTEYCVCSIFDDGGGSTVTLRSRQLESFAKTSGDVSAPGSDADVQNSYKASVSCSSGSASSEKDNYVINVMSAGPDRDDNTRYDNVYALPDDPNNW